MGRVSKRGKAVTAKGQSATAKASCMSQGKLHGAKLPHVPILPLRPLVIVLESFASSRFIIDDDLRLSRLEGEAAGVPSRLLGMLAVALLRLS